MKRLKFLFVGFLIGNTAHYYREMLDLTHVWGIAILLALGVSYLWLENSIEKKKEQNIIK